jgi:excisionase family DNA binding protein
MGRLLRASEVAERLRLSRERVYSLTRAGVLPARRVGPRTQLLFDEAEVMAALSRVGREPAACSSLEARR